jgi:hypothetical protein
MNDEGVGVRSDGRQRICMLLWISLVAALGVVGILVMTPFGSGLFEDSLLYIAGADGILKGHGFSSGIEGTWWAIQSAPPFYSMMLAVLGFFGVDLWAAARWLNAFLMGLNIWLAAYIVLKRTKTPPLAALLVALFLLACWRFAWVHSMVMTEPLFICFVLLGLIILLRYLETPRWLGLAASAGAFGLALATRFFGLPLAAAGGICVLLLSRGPLRRRFAAAAAFSLIAFLPFLLFCIRSKLLPTTGGPVSVSIRYLGFPTSFGHDVLSVLGQLWPSWVQFRPAMALAIVAGWLGFGLLLGLCFIHLLFRRWPTEKRPLLVLGLCVACYTGFYLYTVLFVNWSGSHAFSMRRYMMPLFPLLVIFSSIVISGSLSLHSPKRLWNSLALLVSGLLLMGQFRIGWVCLEVLKRDGQEFAGREWRLSPSIAYVKNLPADVSLFSNYTKLLWFYTGKPARELPYLMDFYTQQIKTDAELAAEIGALRPALETPKTVIVLFNSRWHVESMSLDKLQSYLPLKTMAKLPDGSVFEVQK